MKILFIDLLIILSLGCAEKEISTDSKVLKIDWKSVSNVIDYSPMVEDSVTIIPLETTDECLIGEVSKLIFQNNQFYIADNISKSLFVFDMCGKLKTKVHAVGNGPGEYSYISYFAVHGTDMVLFDHYMGKFFFYDSSGKFIRDKSIADMWTSDLFCMEDKLYLPNNLSSSRNGFYHLFTIDLKNSDKVKRYLQYVEPQDNRGWGIDSFYAQLENEALLCLFPYDELYNVKDEEVSLAYKIDFGNKRLPKHYIEGDGTTALRTAFRDNYVTGLQRVRQSREYIFLYFSDSENDYMTLYNKETGEMQTTKDLRNSLLGNLALQLNGEKFTIQDEKIIQCYDADYWHKFGSSEYIESKDTHFYTEELRQKFLKLAQTDGSESNPIILIQKLKK